MEQSLCLTFEINQISALNINLVVFVLNLVALVKGGTNYENYLKKRKELFDAEANLMVGSDIILSDNEQHANEIMMKLKNKEVNKKLDSDEPHYFSKHYFDIKDDIDKSALYQIIKRMPKGAGLHYHDMALMDPDFVINITYMDNLYVCMGHKPLFKFSDSPPKSVCESEWKLMNQTRFASHNVTEFDDKLRQHFTLVKDMIKDNDSNTIWQSFMNIYAVITPLLTYRPVWEKYFEEAIKAYMKDGMMYLEIRSILPPLYELNGTVHDQYMTAICYKNVAAKIKLENPEFKGAKLIYAPSRRVAPANVKAYLDLAQQLQRDVSDFFAGFDLVTQEDMGGPLREFAVQLVNANLTYYFHAGETNWYGFTDENLIDAIALGAKRLGHAYALPKHPTVADLAKEYSVAIEVNVVSNQVLALVDDFRNHPLAYFLANGFPVVISGDDPGLWEAPPISHDFFIAWVGIASTRADIRMLKQLAINSIKYSALSFTEKAELMMSFQEKWAQFINEVIVNNRMQNKNETSMQQS